jgi:hypothetical protein
VLSWSFCCLATLLDFYVVRRSKYEVSKKNEETVRLHELFRCENHGQEIRLLQYLSFLVQETENILVPGQVVSVVELMVRLGE